jgi:hypothetical protein
MDTVAEKLPKTVSRQKVYDDGNAPAVNQRKDAVDVEEVGEKCVAVGNIWCRKPS